MLRFPLLAAAVCAAFLPLQAQVSVGGLPYSLRTGEGSREVPLVSAPAFDAAEAALRDAQRDAAGLMPAYSRILPLDAGLATGQWLGLPDGGRVWRLRVKSTGALATELYFSDFNLPATATMHVYTEDGRHVLGGFTAANNIPDGDFATSLLPGDRCVIEYHEPAPVIGQGRFRLTGIGHAYRHVGEVLASGACQVDVNCSEGSAWQEQRDAVVRIGVVIGGWGYWCSGALVNNLAQDCKPYFLTAMHCSVDEGVHSTTANFNQWKFYFNYERSGCGTGATPSNRTVTGCVKLGSSNDNGGDNGSDFLLVEGKTAIPHSYSPYWAGWDASGAGSANGVGIHHPDGDRKKISTYNTALSSTNWSMVPNTHWKVRWAATANGHGVTEVGSSGSALFNSAKRVVGTLTGGSTSCTNLNGFDYYGKMSYHWSSNPGTATMYLKNFLDPANTGTKVMDGSYDPCGQYAGITGPDRTLPHLGVYPNPAMDMAVVELPEGVRGNGRVELRDMAGRLVLQMPLRAEAEVRLPVSAMENGAYVVQVLVQERIMATAALIVAGR